MVDSRIKSALKGADYGAARIKWILRQREIFEAQLSLLRGEPANPFDGASDDLIFAKSNAARQALEGWILEINTMLGLDDAPRS